jgi:hypothetical protein
MNPLGTRARAEELASLLDGAVAGPGTLTAPYAGLAIRLRALAPALEATLGPRAEFRAALRQRLVAVATVQAHSPAAYAEPVERPRALDAAVSWSQSRKAQRRIGATAGAMASVIALTGVAVAATRSLPGQPFYGLKRTGESVQLSLASGDTAKGSKHLEFAATRLREVKALAGGDGALSLGGAAGTPLAGGLAFGGSLSKKIADTLADFDSEARTGTALLTKVYNKTGKPAPLRLITSFSHEQSSRLNALLPSLPAAVQDDAKQSLELVTTAGNDASSLLALGTCGGSCYPGNGGPAVPTVPEPTPAAAATPRADPADSNNGVPGCSCPTPEATPAAPTDPSSPSPAQPEPTTAAQPTPSTTPEPTSTPTGPVVVIPPVVPLPTGVPTEIPLPLPTLPVPVPTLPEPLQSLLPGILPRS